MSSLPRSQFVEQRLLGHGCLCGTVSQVYHLHHKYPVYNAYSWTPTRNSDSEDEMGSNALCCKFILDLFKNTKALSKQYLPGLVKELKTRNSTLVPKPLSITILVNFLGWAPRNFVISVWCGNGLRTYSSFFLTRKIKQRMLFLCGQLTELQ